MLHGGGEEPYNFQNQQGVIDLMEALPQFEFVFADAPVNNLWLQDHIQIQWQGLSNT